MSPSRSAPSSPPVDLGDLPRPVTASLGVAASQGDPAARRALVDAADVALYQAEDRGRDCVAVAGSAVPGSPDDPSVRR